MSEAYITITDPELARDLQEYISKCAGYAFLYQFFRKRVNPAPLNRELDQLEANLKHRLWCYRMKLKAEELGVAFDLDQLPWETIHECTQQLDQPLFQA